MLFRPVSPVNLIAMSVLCTVVCIANDADGGLINVVGAVESSVDSGASAATALKTVDGLELGAQYPTIPTTHLPGNIFGWLGVNESHLPAGIIGWVHYDFGTVENLGEMRFWNYNSNSLLVRSVRDMDVYVSSDPLAYNNNGHSSWSKIATLTDLPIRPGINDPYGEIIDLTDTPARYVRLQVEQIWGGAANVAFAEVQFVTAVPEPGSLVAFLAMTGVFVMRRRRQ